MRERLGAVSHLIRYQKIIRIFGSINRKASYYGRYNGTVIAVLLF